MGSADDPAPILDRSLLLKLSLGPEWLLYAWQPFHEGSHGCEHCPIDETQNPSNKMAPHDLEERHDGLLSVGRT
jgi:hypothetical protein